MLSNSAISCIRKRELKDLERSFMFSVVGAALVPGLRKQGILQKLVSKVTEVVRGLRRGPEKAAKTKTN